MTPALAPAAAAERRVRSVALRLAEPAVGPVAETSVVGRRQLGGGTQATAVERFDVRVRGRGAAGAGWSGSLVHKRTGQAEVVALRAVAEVAGADGWVPTLLEAGVEDAAAAGGGDGVPDAVGAGARVRSGPPPAHPGRPAWIVTPFYEGHPVDRSALPAGLFAALAEIHARYEGPDVEGFDALARVTPEWFRDDLCHGYVVPGIRSHRAVAGDPVLQDALRWVTTVAAHPALGAALDRLTRTLVHGDCHTGNIVAGPGRTTLLDWANARRGPAMLDIANLCDLDSPQFRAYRRTWSRATGRPLDGTAALIGHLYATVQINTQYLVYVVHQGDRSRVGEMCRSAQRAVAELEAIL